MTVNVAITFERRPGQIEIDPFGDGCRPLVFETDDIGRQAKMILADEDVVDRQARCMSGKRELFTEPAAGQGQRCSDCSKQDNDRGNF